MEPHDSGGNAPDPRGVSIDGLPVETWIDVCLSDIHAAIEGLLPAMGTPGARDRIEELLGFTPRPELLSILRQVAAAPESSSLRMGLGRVLIALAILTRRELHALMEPRRLDPAFLRRQAATLPALAHRIQGLEEDIRTMQPAGGPSERERLRNLRVALIPPPSRLQGLAVLAARLEDLANSARREPVDPDLGLTPAEVGWLRAAVDPAAPEEDCAPRPLLDAVALRFGIRGELDLHYRGEGSRDRLTACAAACDVAMERIDVAALAAREESHAALVRRLVTVRQDLERLDRKLRAILRGSGARPQRAEEPAAESTLRYQRVAWAAAGTILALVVIGILVLPSGPGKGPALPLGIRMEQPPATVPAEFTRVEQRGEAVVAQITGRAWSRMSDEDRQQRVYGLGVMSFARDVREVWVVDEGGRELAKWFRGGSITLLEPDAP